MSITGMLGVGREELLGYLSSAFLELLAQSVDVNFDCDIFPVSGVTVTMDAT
jgi:hypothetical protein